MESTLNNPIYWSLIPMPADWTANPPGDDFSFLSPAERVKLASLRLPKRRTEWLHGRRIAKQLLFNCFPQLAGSDPAQVSVLNTLSGAPYFADANGMALPLALSLSHRAGWAACAVTDSPGLSIGIDLECIEPRADSFMETFFTVEEIATTRSFNGVQRDVWITLVWSMKEAALKALRQGLRLDTRSIQIQPTDSITGEATDWQSIGVQCSQTAPAHWSTWFMRRDALLISMAITWKTEQNTFQLLQSDFTF
jgi:4'-phosphopantetheinyl transferase